MPVRLLQQWNGQLPGTTYWGADEATLRIQGLADDRIELATDYEPAARIGTTAAVNIVRSAFIYRMNNASAQTLNLPTTGYWPIGTVLTVIQEGAGATTLVPATGVTVNTALASLVTKGQWNIGQLFKRGNDLWVAFGGFGG